MAQAAAKEKENEQQQQQQGGEQQPQVVRVKNEDLEWAHEETDKIAQKLLRDNRLLDMDGKMIGVKEAEMIDMNTAIEEFNDTINRLMSSATGGGKFSMFSRNLMERIVCERLRRVRAKVAALREKKEIALSGE